MFCILSPVEEMDIAEWLVHQYCYGLWRNLIARKRNLDARVPAVLEQENDRWMQGTRKFSLGELKEEETGMEAAAGGSRT